MRKSIRIRAEDVEAGDLIVIKDGTIRKYRHVCEVSVKEGRVHIIYNVPGGFGHIRKRATAAVRVVE